MSNEGRETGRVPPWTGWMIVHLSLQTSVQVVSSQLAGHGPRWAIVHKIITRYKFLLDIYIKLEAMTKKRNIIHFLNL